MGFRAFPGNDVAAVVVPGLAWAAVWTLGRLAADTHLIEGLALYAVTGHWSVPSGKKLSGDEALAVRKFREAAWRCCAYSIDCVLGLWVLLFADGRPKPWMWDDDAFVAGWPHHEVTADMTLMYAVGIGLYLHQVHGVLTDVRMKDFPIMLTHHVVTLALLVFTWYMRYFRGGSFVITIHDFSDIFLESAKCMNYAKRAHPGAYHASTALFAVFAASFYYLRLWIYPKRIVWLAITRGCDTCACWPDAYPGGWGCGAKFYLIIGFFCTLTVLQAIWGFAIAKLLYKIVVLGEEAEDIRETEAPVADVNGKKKTGKKKRKSKTMSAAKDWWLGVKAKSKSYKMALLGHEGKDGLRETNGGKSD